MIFLAILFFFGIYLLITYSVIKVTADWARENKRRAWLWGGLAAFVMYNLVFWDWLPTVAAHKYYCATEAGFWVYKTPEQWKAENPKLEKIMSQTKLSDRYRIEKVEEGFKTLYSVNQHITVSSTVTRVLSFLE
ncbi:MAG: hypothetical protein ABL925_20380, partial [Methylococcales bacterium]